MSDRPDWWELAEAEIDTVVTGFTEKLKEKLAEMGNRPMLLLGRKNPFLFRIRRKTRAGDLVQHMIIWDTNEFF